VPAGGNRGDSAVKHTIFLSYSSSQGEIAARIELALKGEGHAVFRDRSSLPAGESFDERIRNAIEESDLLVFLISRDSVAEGRYTLTELKFAEQKWPHPGGRVLPVYAEETPKEAIPPFLRAVTILRPRGNLVAEVAAEVDRMTRPWWRRMMEPKRLVPTVILALLLAGGAWMWLPPYLERREQTGQAAALAKQVEPLRDAGNYAGAWDLLQQASITAPGSSEVLQAQEKLAMEWLRDGPVGDIKEFARTVEPVLSRGAARERGERLADLLAHMGWLEHLRMQGGIARVEPAQHYRRALEVDPGNAYAHAMWGYDYVLRRRSLADAKRHFSAAVESRRDRGFVRRLQLSSLLQFENVERESEAIRAVSEMRNNGEPRPQGWVQRSTRSKLWHVYYRHFVYGDDKPRFLTALPPAEHLSLFRWLFPEDDFPEGQTSFYFFYLFVLAQLQEQSGDRAGALASYRSLLQEHSSKGFDAGYMVKIVNEANAAIKRLAG
jgi:tetratricopeptide (TPR) repeat protein